MTVWLLNEQYIFELPVRASESKVIFLTALAFNFTCIGIEHASLAEVVERKIGVRQFFFQFRSIRDNFDQPLRENERVIAKPYDILEECLFVVHGQRFSTPSGIS